MSMPQLLFITIQRGRGHFVAPIVQMRMLGEVTSHCHPGECPKPFLSVVCLAELTSRGPGGLGGGPGATLCCCFSSSICCREKNGRRREGGSSGWRRPHSSKLLACRHRTCRRRFFLCRVLKWQYSQAKGLAPVSTCGGCLCLPTPSPILPEKPSPPQGPLQLPDSFLSSNTCAAHGGEPGQKQNWFALCTQAFLPVPTFKVT